MGSVPEAVEAGRHVCTRPGTARETAQDSSGETCAESGECHERQIAGFLNPALCQERKTVQGACHSNYVPFPHLRYPTREGAPLGVRPDGQAPGNRIIHEHCHTNQREAEEKPYPPLSKKCFANPASARRANIGSYHWSGRVKTITPRCLPGLIDIRVKPKLRICNLFRLLRQDREIHRSLIPQTEKFLRQDDAVGIRAEGI